VEKPKRARPLSAPRRTIFSASSGKGALAAPSLRLRGARSQISRYPTGMADCLTTGTKVAAMRTKANTAATRHLRHYGLACGATSPCICGHFSPAAAAALTERNADLSDDWDVLDGCDAIQERNVAITARTIARRDPGTGLSLRASRPAPCSTACRSGIASRSRKTLVKAGSSPPAPAAAEWPEQRIGTREMQGMSFAE
jgi:hypothetical protein